MKIETPWGKYIDIYFIDYYINNILELLEKSNLSYEEICEKSIHYNEHNENIDDIFEYVLFTMQLNGSIEKDNNTYKLTNEGRRELKLNRYEDIFLETADPEDLQWLIDHGWAPNDETDNQYEYEREAYEQDFWDNMPENEKRKIFGLELIHTH